VLPLTDFKQPSLRANVDQTAYIPAAVSVDLSLRAPQIYGTSNLPIQLGTIKLDQGQMQSLGRVLFAPAVDIVVKVVDESGKPVVEIPINCLDGRHNSSDVTDQSGMAHLQATVNSSGKIAYSTVDLKTGQLIENSIPYHVGGPEDEGKTFELQLPEGFLKIYRSISSNPAGKSIRQ
jgi:hypothetical protein